MKYAPSPELCAKYGLPRNTLSRDWMLTHMDAEERHSINLSAHHPDMVREAQKRVLATVTQFEEWARDTHNMPKSWDIVTRFEWGRHRNRSWGGKYSNRSRSYEMGHSLGSGARISLAMAAPGRVPVLPITEFEPPRVFQEYKSFARDPEIGDWVGGWVSCLQVLTIHECAHGLQYSTGLNVKDYAPKERRGHNKLWKDLYRAARREFGFVLRPSVAELPPITAAKEEDYTFMGYDLAAGGGK